MQKIAASIVTYKSPLEDVTKAAHSFIDSGVDGHLTVVDNNSGTEYWAALQQTFSAHFIQNTSNRGFGAAHNTGLRNAPASEYYLVLNPDVIIPTGELKKMIEYMDANPDVGLLTPRVCYPDGSLQPLNKRIPTVFDLFARRFLPSKLQQWKPVKGRMERYMMLDAGYDSIYEVPYATGCFMLFRRAVLERIGGFDENIFLHFEDADITMRTNRVSKTVYYPHAHIIHLWNREGYHSIRGTLVMLRSAFYLFNKWGWRWW